MGTAALAIALASPAHAQDRRRSVQIHPTIEVDQVLETSLQDKEVLTYTEISAGINASVHTRRVQVQLDYRFRKRIGYDERVPDSTVHSGLATAQATITPGFTMEAGAIATRARSDIRGAAPAPLAANAANISQVYSAYVGPNVSTNVGPMFVNGAYRFGYTKVEEPNVPSEIPGEPPLDLYDSSKVHVASASVGVKSGTVLPVGITVSGGYTREDASQLDQRFEGKFGRGDVVLPVGGGLAVGAGAGYENIRISQRDPLRDGNGDPVRDGAGRLQTDPGSPRRLAYDMDGLFWDAGVIWRPSRRTMLELRVGQRYDSWSVTGSFSHQMSPGSAIQVGIYDSVTSFGQQLNGGIASLPDEYTAGSDSFGRNYSGCLYGGSGGSGGSGSSAGSCLNSVFASIPTSNFRARGATAVVSMERGPNQFGIGIGYARRDFIAPTTAGIVSVDGSTDQAYFVQAFAQRRVSRDGTLSANVFASYFSSDFGNADGVMSWGANTSYTHSFGRLGAVASLGLYGYDTRAIERDISAQALIGLSYGF